MRVALVCLLALAACEPDYADTAFRCDAQRSCPNGQTCEYGRCRRGGVTGQVECGADTCLDDQQCCVDHTNAPRCIPAEDVCPGTSALCDGVEDCQTGDRCCNNDTVACGGSCADGIACTDDDDCPSDEPHCCPAPNVPWGECRFASC